ncbi:MAG: anthranilate phosphoribosyltransferase, partial [Planctomycetota bacterium]|nr:anthranilate phosphoribosyltransferase [Planctomycetota bacterium]
FEGERGALRSIVIANAGAALYTAGAAPSLLEGCQSAKEAIDSGAAGKLPAAWARLSREHPTPLG